VKCGGKGKAFEKPGPHERFKAGVRRVARERAMADRGHAPQFQRVVDAIDGTDATDFWKRRAKVDVTPFFLAALSGRAPGLVAPECGKCLNKTGSAGHSHSAFCNNSGKPREADKKAKKKVFAELRRISHEVAASQFMVRRRAPFAN
jgi:hypothetical protein